MIEFKDVTLGYSSKEVLSNVNVELKQGKLTILIGKNGSGKSTLLHSILNPEHILSGSVLMQGIDLTHLSEKEKAAKLFLLEQKLPQTSLQVEQLVLHGRYCFHGWPNRYDKKDRQAANQAIEQMELSALKEKPLSKLSGGEKQKAFLAMALCKGSPILLLDEPTTYLDIESQKALMDWCKEYAKEHCVLMVMHDLLMAMEYADKIWLADQGKICFQGDPFSLISSGQIEKTFHISICSFQDKNKTKYYYTEKKALPNL
jgi:iron complex transport system ATP-binding protein